MIDDLGWSYVARGMLDEARQHVEEGVEDLWRLEDTLGLCQGWRHLQAIKARRGDYLGARFGLRLIFGASCAISDAAERLEMQAGVLRALVDTCRRQGDLEAWEKYRGLSEILSQRSSYKIHAPSDSRRLMQREMTSSNSDPEYGPRLLLLRHPITSKNEKRALGRHLQDTVPAAGVAQITEAAGTIRSMLSTQNKAGVRVYSSPAKSARLLAGRVAEECGSIMKVDSDLASIDAGELTGLSEEEATSHFPDLMATLGKYRENQGDGFAVEFPEGESFRKVTLRAARFLAQTAYVDAIPEVCVIVGHASSITAILNILEALDRLPDTSSYRYYDVPLASITKIDIDSRSGRIGMTTEL